MEHSISDLPDAAEDEPERRGGPNLVPYVCPSCGFSGSARYIAGTFVAHVCPAVNGLHMQMRQDG